jgi:sec-independent protein translocase protein TatA
MFNMDKTLIIVLILVLVIFGPTQLPKLAKMFGKSAKAMKDGLDGTLADEEDEKAAKPKAAADAPKAAADAPKADAPDDDKEV